MTSRSQRMFSVLAITAGFSLCAPAPRAKARDMGPSGRIGSSYRTYGRGDSRFLPGRVGTTVRRHSTEYHPLILREPHRALGPRDRYFPGHSYSGFGHHRSFVGRGSYGTWPSFYRRVEPPYEPYWPSYVPYRDRYDYQDYLDAYRQTERYLILQETVRQREQAVYDAYQDLLGAGLVSFRDGDYRQAANQFAAAAEANQGDAACRIHAAQALFAVGDYRSAVVLLRRAFQLQPKIVALPYDVRSDYTDPQDFAMQLGALEAAVLAQPDDPTLLLLLGYVRMYSGDRDGAYQALRAAVRLSPRDDLALRLLEATRLGDLD
jgi:hypothetical protein